jgi:hypothetical protein
MIGREYLESSDLSLKLDITVPYQDMLIEAKQLREFFIPYHQGNDYRHSGWHSLPLHGLGDDKTLAWRGYGYTDGFLAAKDMHWTSWADKCPVTVDWLKTVFPSQFYGRVRFMLLEAGGFIAPHHDGPDSYLEAVNVALNNPPNCVWRWDNSILEFNPGDAIAVNISNTHEICNNSNEDRYHMIIHHYDSTTDWKELMIRSMEKENVQGNFLYRSELY